MKPQIKHIYAIIDEKGNILDRFNHKISAQEKLHKLKLNKQEKLMVVKI